MTMSAENPKVTDAAAGTNGSSQQSASSTASNFLSSEEPHFQYFVSGSQSQSEAPDSSLVLGEAFASWTIGEQVPLDSDDDIDSGIYAPHEVFASGESDQEDRLESIADGSEEPVPSWTIGEQVPLDSDDDIDSGIYEPHEVFESAENDHEDQLGSIANGSEKPVVYWTIGEQVPLDSDDDIDSGVYEPHEVFASAENDHEDQLDSATAEETRDVPKES